MMHSFYFVCVLCVGFVSITSFRLPPVTDYSYRESTSVELLSLEHPPSYRQRRSDDCSPDHIGVRFTADNNEVKLTLQRNYDINVNAPLFVSINGTITQETLENSENVAVYQDFESGSAILIQCVPSTRKFELFGTFYNGSEELMIEPEFNEGQEEFPDASLDNVQSRDAKSKKEQVWQDQDFKENFTISHHVIYKGKPMRPKESDFILKAGLHAKYRAGTRHNGRFKRATTAYQVELLMVADYSAYSFWFTKSSSSAEAKVLLRQFYAFVLNGIDLRYKSLTGSGFTITVLFAGLYIAETPSDALWTENRKFLSGSVYQVNATAALGDFEAWIQNRPNLPGHDHAMLFTAYDLEVNGNRAVAGLAYLGTTCTESSQSIVEDNFDTIMMTIAAHELGHSLGAWHDGTQDGTGNSCSPTLAHIMSASITLSLLGTPEFQYNKNLWKFSPCSISYFQTYINKLNSTNCLTTLSVGYNSTALSPYDQQNPGQVYSADTQCRYTEGNDSYLCRTFYVGNYTNLCTAFYCQTSGSLYCSLSIAAEKTTCGDRKWCVAGECVTATEAPSVNETCPFGNQPGIVASGQTCTQLVESSSFNCYNYAGSCCESCQNVYTGISGCEYGDKSTGCLARNCAFYDNTSQALCCKTCYVPPATTTTTTAPTKTTAIRTTITNASSTTSTTTLRTTTTTSPITSTLAATTTSASSKATGITAALTPTPTTAAPTPVATTAASTPSTTTVVPTPVATTASPTPSTTTAAPPPITTTAAPTPTPTTVAPMPIATTAALTPSTTTAAPTPVATTAAPTPTTTMLSSTPVTTTAAPAPSTTMAAPTLVTTTASPTPSTTTAAPTPVTTTSAPTPSTTTAAPLPITTKAAPTSTTTTVAPTPVATTADLTPSTATAAPPPVTRTAAPTQTTTMLAPTPVPTPSTSMAAPTPNTTTGAPASITTIVTPTPNTTTAAQNQSTTTAAPTPATTTSAPAPSTTMIASTPSMTTAAHTPTTATTSAMMMTTGSTTKATTANPTTTSSATAVITTTVTPTTKTTVAITSTTMAASIPTNTTTAAPATNTTMPTFTTITTTMTASTTAASTDTTRIAPTNSTTTPLATVTTTTGALNTTATVPIPTTTTATTTTTVTPNANITAALTSTTTTAIKPINTTIVTVTTTKTTPSVTTITTSTSAPIISTKATASLSTITSHTTTTRTTTSVALITTQITLTPVATTTTSTTTTTTTAASTTSATIAPTSTKTASPSTTTVASTDTTMTTTLNATTMSPTTATTTAVASNTTKPVPTTTPMTAPPTTSTTTTTAAPTTTSKAVFPSTSISTMPLATNTTTEQQVTKKTAVTVRLNYNVSSADNLSDSSTYSRYVDIVGESLREYYTRKVGHDAQINIRDIRRGSLIVEYDVIIKNLQTAQVALAKANIDLAAGENITVGGQVSGVESMVVENVTVPIGNSSSNQLCTVYILISGGCPDNYKCVVFNNSPMCQPITTTIDIVPVTVAAAVAGLVIVIAVVALICSLQRRSKHAAKHLEDLSNDSSSDRQMKLPRPVYSKEGYPRHELSNVEYPNDFAHAHKWYPGYSNSNTAFDGGSGEINSHYYYIDPEH